jgi:hypothetical protein
MGRVSLGQRSIALREERRRQAGAEGGMGSCPVHRSAIREAESGKRRAVKAKIDGNAPRDRRRFLRRRDRAEHAPQRPAAQQTRTDGDVRDARRGKRRRLVRHRNGLDSHSEADEVTGGRGTRYRVPPVPIPCGVGERQRSEDEQERKPNPGSVHWLLWLSVNTGDRPPAVNQTRRARPSPEQRHRVLRSREGLARSTSDLPDRAPGGRSVDDPGAQDVSPAELLPFFSF